MCKEILSINDLVEAANRDDRFQLLNSPSVLAGNLDNAIHPLFHDSNLLEKSPYLRQALQLASLFLAYDSVLEFFIPLTYGRYQTDTATRKTYLTNPVASKSAAEIKSYIAGVRKALYCLEHCVTFRWMPDTAKRLWARTVLCADRRPAHTSDCFQGFKYKSSVLIEINEKIRLFYEDEETGYRARSRCDQFRHDFQTAVTMVHEVVHAHGIMRRGCMLEPDIRLDHPERTEWGYAWENYMFGSVINPQDRSRPGTHVLLRKTWSDDDQARRCGGKEYSAVAVSWVAQWFRTETWARIEKQGPLAVPPSTIRVKFLFSPKHHSWVVITDAPETQSDIEQLHDEATMACAEDKSHCQPSSMRNFTIGQVLWTLVDSKFLQKSNVPIPTRIPPKLNFSAVTGPSTLQLLRR
ncbi:hypothetical protein K458DRAFT_465407 [Lentithecium fluviatile CBS 122367]|uniref:Uncharacterized protein n=1 Tax=Lentithecium fluviatile CBS 122367 TaxID=1168545 RepID=A0A6G1JF69_9PLEO|nr:hypothetical protein K458DRAFT_465407 [Lentithecium fluviatile CBS 122367]